jgi:hypothetical protein
MVRRSATTVTFSRPFILDGFSRVEPPGVYLIEVEEERVEQLSCQPAVWREVNRSIRLEYNGVVRFLSVDPSALSSALERDTAQDTQVRLRKLEKARRETARNMNAFLGRRAAYE